MKKILTALVLVGAALSLSACGDDHPGEHCVKKRTDYVPITIVCGNGCITTTIVPSETCTKWAPDNPATVKP